MSKEAPSRSKELGPQLFTGGQLLSFKRRPPLSINPDIIPQPIRDDLLAGGGSVFLEALSQLGLTAACALDCPLQGADMDAHGDAGLHKRACLVNRQACVTTDKKVCNVVDLDSFRFAAVPNTVRKLPTAKQKSPNKRDRKAMPGPDGKTLGERLQMAMAYRAGVLGRAYEPVHLLDDANRSAGATRDAPMISQQMISEILRNRTTRSSFTPFLAKACGVSVLWLANGRGPMIERP